MAEEVAVQNQEAAPAERPKVDKPEVLIFGKYSTNDIVIECKGAKHDPVRADPQMVLQMISSILSRLNA